MTSKFNYASFFDLSIPLQKIQIEGPEVGGVMATELSSESDEDFDPQQSNNDYAQQFQDEEDELALALDSQPIMIGLGDRSRMSGLEEFTSVSNTVEHISILNESTTNVYRQYNFKYNAQEPLPIHTMKDSLLNLIDTNQVVIIQGATGCGKSTQVPQFILDNCQRLDQRCKIVVTQPRRIAAISIAKRVAEQRKWPLGSIVGYQVGLQTVQSEETLLTFMTTGVLLQKLIAAQNLNEYTHILLDEVHEREQEMDFVMLLVRKFMRTNSRNVKIILMSATFDTDKFSKYFSQSRGNRLESAIVAEVPSTSKYIVQDFYLNELARLAPIPDVKFDEPMIAPEMFHVCGKLIQLLTIFDQTKDVPGSVLVFLPGIHEIEEMDTYLNMPNYKSDITYDIIPLHSTITTDEQKMVFINPQPKRRKIILSTNIAESSITVPDIQYIIDFCLTKELHYDSKTTFNTLQLRWASKTNCIQRAGRAGRVADGRVYRLLPESFYNELNVEGEPEMLRAPLDRLVLNTKKLHIQRPPHEILALALDPPNLHDIERTVLILKEMGALLMTLNDKWCRNDGDLTYFGHVMSVLPLDVRISKLILLGYLFSCLEECIIMAAGMNTKNVFSAPYKEGMNAYNSKLSWADGSCSDLIAILNVYKVWRHNNQENLFSSNRNKRETLANWGKRHFIQYRMLREMHYLIDEIKMRLKSFNIVEMGRVKWKDLEKPLVLKVVICGAFYPNYFIRFPNQIDERDAVKVLGGRQPNNTVYLQGMDSNQPGQLYVSAIKQALMQCGNDIHVSFDQSNKVFIQFLKETQPSRIREANLNFIGTMPGNVALEVFRAVRLRQLYKSIRIPILPVIQARERIRSLNLVPENESLAQKMAPILPGLEISIISLKISHVVDPGHFWAQSVHFQAEDDLNEINRFLRRASLIRLTDVANGALCAAPFEGAYYRARCESIRMVKMDKKVVQVFFLDYGNYAEIAEEDLRILPADLYSIRAQAFECVLCMLQPSLLLNSRAIWTDEAYELFYKYTEGKSLFGKIYSVTQGIISLELFYSPQARPPRVGLFGRPEETPLVDDISINNLLLDNGVAQSAEESYLSKWNHKMREMQMTMEMTQRESYNAEQANNVVADTSTEITSPTAEETRFKFAELKGPYSPLETRVYGVNVVNMYGYSVTLDSDSVNCVLLDTEPQDIHERLLVAANVATNSARNRLTLRQTTVMPNIHGFPAIMALLFCPQMELRTNEQGTKYAAALCGLGPDPITGKALLRDHDLLINIDVDITLDDINVINSMRYFINVPLIMEHNRPFTCAEDVMECQHKIQTKLLQLLQLRRATVEVAPQVHKDTWGQCNEMSLLRPDSRAVVAPYAVYHLHNCIDLSVEERVKSYEVQQNKLLQLSRREIDFPDEVTCPICDVTVLNIASLRVHLVSVIHKNKCAQYGIQ